MAISRPTIRCLWDDLASELRGGGPLEAEIRERVNSRILPHPSFRLDEVNHPIMNDVRAFFIEAFREHLRDGGDVPDGRLFSLGRAKGGRGWGMRWYEARSDEHVHLRGLVCLVEEYFWLGWEGDRNEEYSSFNDRRNAEGNTHFFEPTDDDWIRLRIEDAWESEAASRIAFSSWFVGTVLEAWRSRAAVAKTSPDGDAVISVEVTAEDPSIAELEVEVEIGQWQNLDKIMSVVLESLPGVDAVDWEVSFADVARQFRAYTMIDAEFADRLAELEQTHGIEFLVAHPETAADPGDDLAQITSLRVV